ncbi:MAG: hypothetical protein J5543_08360 [Bacteroidales bacterium]|nr:hypothetical protein [Bacteroidales bacterium]
MLRLAMVPMMAMAALMMSACQSHEDGTDPAYNVIVDVNMLGWNAGDTLFFPIHVTNPSTIRDPIVQGIPYQVGYSIRMSADYRFTRVPMQLIVQQTDTTGGHEHIVRNVMREHIAPAVRDTLGHPLGPSWGSLIDYDNYIENLIISFDSTGTYRMMLIPDLRNVKSFVGLSAIGITLSKQY